LADGEDGDGIVVRTRPDPAGENVFFSSLRLTGEFTKNLNSERFSDLQSHPEVLLMNSFRLLVAILALLVAVPAVASDQQKAQKEMVKVTAMACDFTGRSIVNLSMSQAFNVPRTTLVTERGETGLNYGSLLLAHELIKSGATIEDIVAQLKVGKKITAIADERHVDWKAIAEDEKKFNSLVDNNLYKYFMMQKETVKPAAMQSTPKAEEYDVHYDGVKADADVEQKDIEDAGQRFRTIKDSAAKAKGHNQGLDLQHERIGYADHTQGPSSPGSGTAGSGNTTTGVNVPGFGGPP
jgi:hypothetical protein